MAQLKGVVGTPVTPFTDTGELDRATLEKLVAFLLDTKIDALALPMHIGESLNLSNPERKQVAEIAVATVAGQVPVLVNVSLSGTDEVIELAQHSERIGADGVIVTAPYHWQPPKEALVEHFLAVGRSVEIGLVAYNYPARLGVEVSTEIVAELIGRLDNFVGLKDASFNMEYFTELCRTTRELRPSFSNFTGVEYVLPSMVVGGAGCFSALGGVAPVLVRQLYDACAAGAFEEALELQYEFSHVYKFLQVGYPATIKAAMGFMGRPVGGTRKPLQNLSAEAVETLGKRLREFAILGQEPHGWEVQTRV